MPVLKHHILKAATLARLDLPPEEETNISYDLTEILEYIDRIGRAETDKIESGMKYDDPESIFRGDIVGPSLAKETALGNAPDKYEDFFRVPRVLG